VLFPKRALILSGLCLGLPLASCANSSLGEALQRSVAPDPQLASTPAIGASPTPTSAPQPTATLPSDFPPAIPRYPNAALVAVTAPDANQGATETRWQTTDTADRIQQFYQDTFRAENWQVEPSPPTATGSDTPLSLIAEKNGLRVRVAIDAADSPAPGQTVFTVAYYEPAETAASPDAPSPASTATAPQPGDPNFIGPVLPSNLTAGTADGNTSGNGEGAIATTPSQFTDLAQAPEELRPYIRDLAQLGILSLSANSNSSSPTEFQPNQIITRREYARWLVATNNAIYGNQPANRIRLGVSTAQPAFQDVPRTDPDFPAIQGLAEAGLIPSPLSGDATTVTFRPDAPLTRESLILWKTPVDLRQTLPNASIEAVQQTWGFQDAARIDPKALRAVLADFQNGEQSNIRRAFGYTTLFQPKKTVTRAEAAAVLWFFGSQGEGVSAKDVLQGQQSGNTNPTSNPSTTVPQTTVPQTTVP
jgi:S-layer homology domain